MRRTRMPRLLGRLVLASSVVTGLGAGALVGLVPASAVALPVCQGNKTPGLADITIWQATGDPAGARSCTPTPGAVISGTWVVRVDADSATGLSAFTVSLAPAGGSIPALGSAATISRTYPALPLTPTDTVQVNWDPRLTPYNGQYTLNVSAMTLNLPATTASVGNLLINNPPAVPTGVAATLKGTVPTISWNANSEPDLTGYQVLRAGGDGKFAPVGTATTNQFSDSAAPQDQTFTYEVVALRKSPVTPGGIASPASSSASVSTGGPLVAPPGLATKGFTPLVVPKAIAQLGPTTETTFAPTLPFNQPVPAPQAADLPGNSNTQALTTALGMGAATTTYSQKLRFLVTAAFILLTSVMVIKYARKLLKGS